MSEWLAKKNSDDNPNAQTQAGDEKERMSIAPSISEHNRLQSSRGGSFHSMRALLRQSALKNSIYAFDKVHSGRSDSVYRMHEIATSASLRAWELDLVPNGRTDIGHSKRGSLTGLNEQSEQAVRWVHAIPFWAKPIITGALGVLDVIFRVLSTYYLAASVSELLSTGLDMVAGVLAARYIRKREILPQRWLGVGIATLGLLVITCSEFVDQEEKDSTEEEESDDSDEPSGSNKALLGVIFVLANIVAGTLKDIVQELFTQVSDFPAAQLLGLEGIVGVVFTFVIYLAVGSTAGFSPMDTVREITSSKVGIGMTIGLVAICFLAALYSILATCVTSAMTKNMWKNVRGVMVWVVGLVLFYASKHERMENLGEQWLVPGSLLILAGSGVLLVGIYVYYRPSVVPQEPPHLQDIIEMEEQAPSASAKLEQAGQSGISESST